MLYWTVGGVSLFQPVMLNRVPARVPFGAMDNVCVFPLWALRILLKKVRCYFVVRGLFCLFRIHLAVAL